VLNITCDECGNPTYEWRYDSSVQRLDMSTIYSPHLCQHCKGINEKIHNELGPWHKQQTERLQAEYAQLVEDKKSQFRKE